MKRLSCLFFAAFLSTSANASIIFQDNFDSEAGPAGNSSLNYNSFSNWTVSGGTVDVVANTNPWGISCVGGTGKCIDMDGSTGNAGTLTSTLISLVAGTYTLSFDISGNQRGGASDSMVIDLGGFINESFSLAYNSPWQTVTRTFTVTGSTTNSIIFNHAGGDNVGMMLDNVSLTAQVPTPGSLALMGLGLIGLGAAVRKRK